MHENHGHHHDGGQPPHAADPVDAHAFPGTDSNESAVLADEDAQSGRRPRRDARVGIAALASFLVLVGVLIWNRWKPRSPRETAAGSTPPQDAVAARDKKNAKGPPSAGVAARRAPQRAEAPPRVIESPAQPRRQERPAPIASLPPKPATSVVPPPFADAGQLQTPPRPAAAPLAGAERDTGNQTVAPPPARAPSTTAGNSIALAGIGKDEENTPADAPDASVAAVPDLAPAAPTATKPDSAQNSDAAPPAERPQPTTEAATTPPPGPPIDAIDQKAAASGLVRLPMGEASPAEPRPAETTTDRLAPLPSRPAQGPIEPVLHVVKKGENFWTISRLYYRSGRFYQALWAANRDQVPAPDQLYVGMTIKVPPPDALDRSLILPPRTSRTPAVGGRPAPARRTSATGPGLVVLPVGTPSASPRELLPAADEPSGPFHIVRAHETLRSIARDTLGDARRADEIRARNAGSLGANDDIQPGMRLVLPDDASVARR
jgi:nucleoid-associated protein YgaU